MWLPLLLSLTVAAPLESAPRDATRSAPASALDFPVADEELLGHVFFLSHDRLQGRDLGSAEDRIAATYIEAEFRKLGLEPGGPDGEFEQRFQIFRSVEIDGKVAGIEERWTSNVIAILRGADPGLAEEHIVIGAHYDHIGTRTTESGKTLIYNGADDNASGVAGLLGLAKALRSRENRPHRTIVFVAFGAEEIGLQGARRYVAQPSLPLDRLTAMINLDMIGRGRFLDQKRMQLAKQAMGMPDRGVGLLGGHSARLMALAKQACAAESLASYAPEDFTLVRKFIERAAAGREDSAAFRAKGLPTIFLTTSESDDYHQPTDTIDKIDGETIRIIARAVLRLIDAIDALPAGESLRDEPPTELPPAGERRGGR
ncbi:MAG: M20/M25/M40 family metallo-hydrolase [Planctomycetes bacterium]|nr:M20/M25/M40 family metallo-hydrolase [Planctomycetota bacterium]